MDDDESHAQGAFAVVSLVGVVLTHSVWARLVNQVVPEPYLDEVFHAGQAQEYCNGGSSWDPKITTPPGLYYVSYWMNLVRPVCDLFTLRILNALWLVLAQWAIFDYQSQPPIPPFMLGGELDWENEDSDAEDEDEGKEKAGKADEKKDEPDSRETVGSARLDVRLLHSSLNMVLFPVLFFYSGFYYTDAASVAIVLLTFRFIPRDAFPDFIFQVPVFVLGLAAMTFRQTNVFWVGVWGFGMAYLRILRSRSTNMPSSGARGFHEALVIRRLYEPPVGQADLLDYVYTIISVGVNSVSFLTETLTTRKGFVAAVSAFWPYVGIMASFAGFVGYNGSVVLGDKTNHVATLHIPQFFYLFAYIGFFSIPLLWPYLASLVLPRPLTPSLISNFSGSRSIPAHILLLLQLAVATAFALPAIHFNTIIHPFLLADNRHYIFYVFKYIRQYPDLKYILAPAYALLGWATVSALGRPGPPPNSKRAWSQLDADIKAASFPSTAWVLIWLLASAASVMTAPLVEPRYFIIPWLVWRLHVPHATEEERYTSRDDGIVLEELPLLKTFGIALHGDHRLYLETLWFVAINVVTGYMFLYRPFTWMSEPLSLQRFMW